MRLGLFEQPYTGSRSVDRGPHLELAREAAARCAVLLQNDGILPFGEPEDEQKYGKMKIGGIAVVGPLAEATGALFGTWTLDGNPGEVTSLADALDAALDGQVKRAPWDNPSLCAHMVHQSSAAVVVLGETPNRSGEANSVADPGLPPGQVAMLEQLLGLGTPIVLVVIAGRPICLPDCVERCAAVLYSFHPGTGGGLGLADVLTGAAEPGGRLPVTLPRHPGQIPLYHDHKPTGRPLDEYHRPKDQAGFYRLLDCRGDPRWPFGAGMSYTSFSVSAPSLLDASLDDGIHCRVSISNTGPRSGSTVVQAYLRDPVAERSQPVRKLAAWERVHLAAGSTTEIDLHLPATSLRYHHRDGSIRADAGLFQVWVGQHTSDGTCLDVSISE
jgi:beta-glucosidase